MQYSFNLAVSTHSTNFVATHLMARSSVTTTRHTPTAIPTFLDIPLTVIFYHFITKYALCQSFHCSSLLMVIQDVCHFPQHSPFFVMAKPKPSVQLMVTSLKATLIILYVTVQVFHSLTKLNAYLLNSLGHSQCNDNTNTPILYL
jgi:hypothetical protein